MLEINYVDAVEAELCLWKFEDEEKQRRRDE